MLALFIFLGCYNKLEVDQRSTGKQYESLVTPFYFYHLIRKLLRNRLYHKSDLWSL